MIKETGSDFVIEISTVVATNRQIRKFQIFISYFLTWQTLMKTKTESALSKRPMMMKTIILFFAFKALERARSFVSVSLEV